MTPIQQITDAYLEGNGAIFISGRSMSDFDIDDDGRIRPLVEITRRSLYQAASMVFVRCSLGTGLDWSEGWIANEKDRHTIRAALDKSGFLNIPEDQNEAVGMVKAAGNLLRTKPGELKWQDGRSIQFAVFVDFTEHLAPCSSNGVADDRIKVIELLHYLAGSIAVRSSGNVLILNGRADLVDDLVTGHIKHVHLLQPTCEQKEIFLSAALTLYDKAAFEEGLGTAGVAGLSQNTPNRGLERLLRASHRTGRRVTAKEVSAQKDADVRSLSEGTLIALDVSRVVGVDLVGTNIETPASIMDNLGRQLLRGAPTMPANIVLAGAPSTGKTDLALRAAYNAQCSAYRMLSPKDSLVGSTERKARLQQQALKDWSPNVAVCDELTEALPMRRGGFNGDSGASDAVSAEILSNLSDETRRGRNLFIGTTNRIESIGEAMRSRFVIIPVLQPLKEDLPLIIASLAKRIKPECDIRADDQKVLEASEMFYLKGASPRYIHGALCNAMQSTATDTVDANLVLFAANDFCTPADRASSEYADLVAIRFCTSRSFLPWTGKPNYRFPEYLRGVVSESTGELDFSALDRRIAELRPYVDV